MTKVLIKDLQLLASEMTDVSVKNISCTSQKIAKICWLVNHVTKIKTISNICNTFVFFCFNILTIVDYKKNCVRILFCI